MASNPTRDNSLPEGAAAVAGKVETPEYERPGRFQYRRWIADIFSMGQGLIWGSLIWIRTLFFFLLGLLTGYREPDVIMEGPLTGIRYPIARDECTRHHDPEVQDWPEGKMAELSSTTEGESGQSDITCGSYAEDQMAETWCLDCNCLATSLGHWHEATCPMRPCNRRAQRHARRRRIRRKRLIKAPDFLPESNEASGEDSNGNDGGNGNERLENRNRQPMISRIRALYQQKTLSPITLLGKATRPPTPSPTPTTGQPAVSQSQTSSQPHTTPPKSMLITLVQSAPKKSSELQNLVTPETETQTTISSAVSSDSSKVEDKESPPSKKKRSSLLTMKTTTFLILSIMGSSLKTSEAATLDDPFVTEGEKQEVFFTAYDCVRPPTISPNSSNITVKAIDLTTIRPCPDAKHDYEVPVVETISLVQTHVPIKIKISRCKLTLTRTFTEHGVGLAYSAIFGARPLKVSEPVRVLDYTCRQMIENKRFRATGDIIGGGRDGPEIDLTMNDEEYASWYPYGGQDKHGYPQEEPHYAMVNGVKMKLDGTQAAVLSVFIEELEGQLDIGASRVWNEQYAIHGVYEEGFKWSHDFGTFAWDKTKHYDGCVDTMALVAISENATIYRMKEHLRPDSDRFEYSGAMVVLKNESSHRAVGLVLKATAPGCLPLCMETNIPYMVACVSKAGKESVSMLDKIETRPVNRMVRLNMHGLGTFLELSTRIGDYELGLRMHEEICKLDIRSIRSEIAMMLHFGNQSPLQEFMDPPDRQVFDDGYEQKYSVSIRGSIAYLLECSPVPVQLVNVPFCVQQIPVIRTDRNDSRLLFVDSITYRLVELPTVIKCTTSLPIMYNINGNYYCHNPQHMFCPSGSDPSVLKPSTGAARGIRLSDLRAIGGLSFNRMQLDVIQKELQVIQYGHQANVIIAGTAIRHSFDDTKHKGSLRLGIPLSNVDITLLKDIIFSQVFILANLFGHVFTNFFGLLVVASLAVHLLGSLARLYHTYRIEGCGCWLPEAVWSLICSVLTLPFTILRAVAATVDDTLTRARDDAMPPPGFNKFRDKCLLLEQDFKRYRDNHVSLLLALQRARAEGVELTIDQIESYLYSTGHCTRELQGESTKATGGPRISSQGMSSSSSSATGTQATTATSHM